MTPDRTSRGINEGRGFVFISHLGEVYPSGFLPAAGGNIRHQSLAHIHRTSPFSGPWRTAKPARQVGTLRVPQDLRRFAGPELCFNRGYACRGTMLRA